MRAVGYFVEGARRGGSKRSVGEQNRAFLDFCTQHGYEVAATFLDTKDKSDGPDSLRQMLTFLRREDRGFMVVVVDSLGTLGSDLSQAAMRLLTIEQTGVSVISAETGREAVNGLLETWAERGSGTPTSERVRSAMRKKAVRGEALGRPPFGYRVGPRRKLELVSDEARIIRYIFRLYLQEGMGVRKIAGQLNREEITTRRGGAWSMVTVRDILRNRVYLGTYSRLGVKIAGSHPALVSSEDFAAVQDRLQTRNPPTRERTVEPFLLSGLVFCARCGSRMIGVTRRQRWKVSSGEEHHGSYRYYQCEARTNRSSCGYNTQRAAELEKRVQSMLGEDSPLVNRIRRAGNADAYVLDVSVEVDRIEGRIKRNRRELEQLISSAAHGHLSLERARALGTDVIAEDERLESELSAAKSRIAATLSDAERQKRLEESRDKLINSGKKMEFSVRRSAFREVIDRIEVDGEEVRLSVRF